MTVFEKALIACLILNAAAILLGILLGWLHLRSVGNEVHEVKIATDGLLDKRVVAAMAEGNLDGRAELRAEQQGSRENTR